MYKPIRQPCLRNQDPIMKVLSKYFCESGTVLELACGTAQHAVYCCQHLTHLKWQPTERADNLDSAQLWVEDADLQNLSRPMVLDINQPEWKVLDGKKFEYAYCSNLIHFITDESAVKVFSGVSKHLKDNGLFAIYGPININGFTSDGNANLDAWLKADIHPKAGIKELESIKKWGSNYGLSLIENESMPANNHILMFKKLA